MKYEYFITIMSYIAIFSFGFAWGTNYKRPKFYRSPGEGWINIKECPIPEDIQDVIVTDGTEVSCEYRIKYNSKGQAIMGYKGGIIKAWMPLPEPINGSKVINLKVHK